MSLHLIVGPMKSGKSQELIAQVTPYTLTDKKVGFYQPAVNIRDQQISSRNGLSVKAQKVKSLSQIKKPPAIIAIDEVHMLKMPDLKVIECWLKDGRIIYLSGLDLDYRGHLIPIVAGLYELKPETVTYKLAVCDKCHQFKAAYTQILDKKGPITAGLPIIVPDKGQYIYESRCRQCFIRLDSAKI